MKTNTGYFCHLLAVKWTFSAWSPFFLKTQNCLTFVTDYAWILTIGTLQLQFFQKPHKSIQKKKNNKSVLLLSSRTLNPTQQCLDYKTRQQNNFLFKSNTGNICSTPRFCIELFIILYRDEINTLGRRMALVLCPVALGRCASPVLWCERVIPGEDGESRLLHAKITTPEPKLSSTQLFSSFRISAGTRANAEQTALNGFGCWR